MTARAMGRDVAPDADRAALAQAGRDRMDHDRVGPADQAVPVADLVAVPADHRDLSF